MLNIELFLSLCTKTSQWFSCSFALRAVKRDPITGVHSNYNASLQIKLADMYERVQVNDLNMNVSEDDACWYLIHISELLCPVSKLQLWLCCSSGLFRFSFDLSSSVCREKLDGALRSESVSTGRIHTLVSIDVETRRRLIICLWWGEETKG